MDTLVCCDALLPQRTNSLQRAADPQLGLHRLHGIRQRTRTIQPSQVRSFTELPRIILTLFVS